MLIVFGGLPGTGKTSLSRELARRLSATYLRIDSIEQAITTSRLSPEAGSAGYFVGYSVAADNLSPGNTVVADSGNSLTLTRDAWIEVANSTSAVVVEIEVICSDPSEHRRRVESRTGDIPGHKLPGWQDVLDRPYEPWPRKHLIVETANSSIEQSMQFLLDQLSALSADQFPGQL
jgi:predicted kinase